MNNLEIWYHTKMTNDVYVEIEDFFSPDSYAEILAYARDENNYDSVGHDPMGFWDNRSKRIEPEEFRTSLTYEFNNKINPPAEITEVNGVVMVKYLDEYSESPDGRHAIYPHFIKNPPQNWDYQVIINLNEDYEGGEIVFPDHNITIKQKANSAVCFRGDTVYQVNKVPSGKKYMLTIFGK